MNIHELIDPNPLDLLHDRPEAGGFTVDRILFEPGAAALWNGMREREARVAGRPLPHVEPLAREQRGAILERGAEASLRRGRVTADDLARLLRSPRELEDLALAVQSASAAEDLASGGLGPREATDEDLLEFLRAPASEPAKLAAKTFPPVLCFLRSRGAGAGAGDGARMRRVEPVRDTYRDHGAAFLEEGRLRGTIVLPQGVEAAAGWVYLAGAGLLAYFSALLPRELREEASLERLAEDLVVRRPRCLEAGAPRLLLAREVRDDGWTLWRFERQVPHWSEPGAGVLVAVFEEG